MQTIYFERKTRGEQKNKKGRVIQNVRNYFDFCVSGQSVSELINSDNLDLITPFGWGEKNYEQEIIKEFIGEINPHIPSGRLMIYVCPECGDIGCGTISADLEITKDSVIWKNFGYENNDPDIDFDPYKSIQPIEFEKLDYLEKFRNLLHETNNYAQQTL